MNARFTIERELGRGGMGVVYLARDRERDGTLVALKRLTVAAPPDALRHEFEAARRLRHPVIVQVHDFGRDGDGPFLTMEYVDGDDLSTFAGRVSPDVVMRWTLRLADALEYARRRSFVHGDIKPQNIMVSRDDPDSVRLLDLGLARVVGTYASGGTPAYLAPEVIAGRAPDTRSDLWSLGCVLYQVLAGRPPFVGLERSDPPAPLTHVPENLNSVINLLLARRPEDRPGRPADLPLLLGDNAGTLLPLPDGDLVGRDDVVRAAQPGTVVVIEAAPGMGATRLLRAIAEDAEEHERERPLTYDVDRSNGVEATSLVSAAAAGRSVVAVFRPGAARAVTASRVFVLAPLDETTLRQLVSSRLPLEEHSIVGVAKWALRESGGVPGIAVEALDALRRAGLLRPGPTGLLCDLDAISAFEPVLPAQSRVQHWIGSLSEVACAAGAKLAISAIAPSHPELDALGWVATIGNERRLVSAAVARALAATLPDHVRQRMHSDEADRLQQLSKSADPIRVAEHLLKAERLRDAGPWLLAAARVVRDAGDRRQARRLLTLAVEHLGTGEQRAAAQLELAHELAIIGEISLAHAAFTAARAEDAALAAASWAGQAELFAERQQHGEAATAALELLQLAERHGDDANRARAHGILGRTEAQQRRYDTARAHLTTALKLHRQLGQVVAVARIGNALGNVAYLEKHLDEAISVYEEALAAARTSGDRRVRASVLLNLSNIYAAHRRGTRAARSIVEEAIEVAEQDGNRASLARTLAVRALLELDAGHADEAERSLARALEIRESIQERQGVIHIRLLQGAMATALGDFAKAHATLSIVLAHGDATDDPTFQVPALDELGFLALERNRWREAKALLERGLELARKAELASAELSVRSSLARALVELGEVDAAVQLLDETAPMDTSEPEGAARLARARAAVCVARGQFAAARQTLEDAVAELTATGFRLELARTLLTLSPVLAMVGQFGAALETVEKARRIFEHYGAKPGLARSLLQKAKLRAEIN